MNHNNNISTPTPAHHKYHMIKSISRLRISNPTDKQSALSAQMEDVCYTLVANLIRSNPTWAIDSLIKYAMAQYKDQGVTYKIISECIYDYVMDKN